MRGLTGAPQARRFMKELGLAATRPARVYLAGGACAVLLGWRETTIDVDIKIVGAEDDVLKAIPRIKEELRVNVELASPDQFIPPLPGWEQRSRFIAKIEPELYRYPALDPKRFRAALEGFLG